MESNFVEIVQIIKQSRTNAIKAVNAELINLYWNVGMYISNKLKLSDWGDKTVADLSEYIQRNNPEIKGFSRRGLYRMIQFYEKYSKDYRHFVSEKSLNIENQSSVIVPTVLTQFKPADIKDSMLSKISWSHHMAIFSRCKVMEERKYYITLCIQENYSFRELERQISASLFERSMIGMPEPTKVTKELNDISYAFKDSYVFDFLNLPDSHSESELQKGLLNRMKDFILELGRDFIFIGEEYKLMVGNSDFYIDLLFYHRGLQCLVAVELKAGKFKPEHIGQLNFYLEALDRDVKKEHENPSIGILLCKDKDNQVVEYALSRSLSPTMVAEYRTQLPDKELLQRKFSDIFEEDDHGIDQD
jgi:predicted nuclease of restriction endonuclease-like (RecB) superfamily